MVVVDDDGNLDWLRSERQVGRIIRHLSRGNLYGGGFMEQTRRSQDAFRTFLHSYPPADETD